MKNHKKTTSTLKKSVTPKNTNWNKIPIMTIALIIINIIMFFIMTLSHLRESVGMLGVSENSLLNGYWWTPFTYMFVHLTYTHLICNMVSLWFIGTVIEHHYGKVKYLLLYFVSGIIGGLIYVISKMMLTQGSFPVAIGASGAIFGLFGAIGYILWENHRTTMLKNRSDITWYLGLLILNLVVGFIPGSNIAVASHIGGLATGFIIAMIYSKKELNKKPSLKS